MCAGVDCADGVGTPKPMLSIRKLVEGRDMLERCILGSNGVDEGGGLDMVEEPGCDMRYCTVGGCDGCGCIRGVLWLPITCKPTVGC